MKEKLDQILDYLLSFERENQILLQNACFVYRKISLKEIYYTVLILFYKLIYIDHMKIRFNFSLIDTVCYFL